MLSSGRRGLCFKEALNGQHASFTCIAFYKNSISENLSSRFQCYSLLMTVPPMTHLHPLDPTFYICFTTGHMTTLWTKLPTYDLSGDILKPNVPFPALWIPVTSCDHFRCSQFLSMSLVLSWGDPTQWLNC